MKRYLLFSGNDYYPTGGWGDFVDDFDTIEEAEAYARKEPLSEWQWWHIIDTETKEECAGDATGPGDE